MSIGDGLTATSVTIARVFFIVSGALAIVWAFAVIPVFWSDGPIIDVARAIIAGEALQAWRSGGCAGAARNQRRFETSLLGSG